MFARRSGVEGNVIAALDAYPDELSGRPTEWIAATFAELQRIRAAVEAKRLAYLAALERAGIHRRDGHVSTAAWIADRFGEAAGTAKREVRTAAALEQAPVVREALRSGNLPATAVGLLVEAREEHPDAFDRAATDLVERATRVSAEELRRVVAEWSQAVDDAEGDELDPHARLRERRALSVCATPSGMVKVAGELDPETGEPVITALRAIVDAGLRGTGSVGDNRTAGRAIHRRAQRTRRAVPDQQGSAYGGRRAPDRDRHDRRGRPRERAWDGSSGSRRRDPCPGRTDAGVRRRDPARRARSRVRTARRWSADAGRPTCYASSTDREGRRMPLPGVRSPAFLGGRASCPTLGGRRGHGDRESRPVVPGTPSTDP